MKTRLLLAVVVAAVCGSVASGQESWRSRALNWQSPVVQQTSGYEQGGKASRVASPRIAMTDGDIVMDGGMMTFDEDPAFAGSSGMSGGMMTEPCTTCRTPPWHGSVAPPAFCGPGQCGTGMCGPVCNPCDPCMECDPCDRPHHRSCFPRLQALFGEGRLLSPMPPCEPRCHQCGAMVEVGF